MVRAVAASLPAHAMEKVQRIHEAAQTAPREKTFRSCPASCSAAVVAVPALVLDKTPSATAAAQLLASVVPTLPPVGTSAAVVAAAIVAAVVATASVGMPAVLSHHTVLARPPVVVAVVVSGCTASVAAVVVVVVAVVAVVAVASVRTSSVASVVERSQR